MLLVLFLFVFMLAIFIGFEIIAKVPQKLHTPLMSGANAISGITIVGALTCARSFPDSDFATFLAQTLGFIAVVTATINVFGGFVVTDRMLAMFGGKKGRK